MGEKMIIVEIVKIAAEKVHFLPILSNKIPVIAIEKRRIVKKLIGSERRLSITGNAFPIIKPRVKKAIK
jgi:hypothetical protein